MGASKARSNTSHASYIGRSQYGDPMFFTMVSISHCLFGEVLKRSSAVCCDSQHAIIFVVVPTRLVCATYGRYDIAPTPCSLCRSSDHGCEDNLVIV